jgi:hypothetical protein
VDSFVKLGLGGVCYESGEDTCYTARLQLFLYFAHHRLAVYLDALLFTCGWSEGPGSTEELLRS